MSALIFDIETAGESLTEIDDQTKELIAKKLNPENNDDFDLEAPLGLSPYTGNIITIGTLDSDSDKGAVYYLDPSGKTDDKEENGLTFRTFATEKELLKRFWEVAAKYDDFVSYNGRGFDVPFILIRSAINEIKPPKDLLRGRYLYQQSPNAVHIDLYDQLTFYGAIRFGSGGSLHMACRAFGIATPKADEIDGSKVTEMFRAKKYREIAEYNGRDLWATRSLYQKWRKFLAN